MQFIVDGLVEQVAYLGDWHSKPRKDRVHHRARQQQVGAGGGGPISARRTVRHPLPRQEGVSVLQEETAPCRNFYMINQSGTFQRYVIAGGGAPETELAYQLSQYAQTLPGVEAYCFR